MENVPEFIRAASPGISGTLEERGKRYGTFTSQAVLTQDLKAVMHCGSSWIAAPPDVKEALHMIASKIARIVNGDSNYADNWHDIQGYAKLVEDRINQEKQNVD